MKKLKVRPLAFWMVVVPMIIAIIYYSTFAISRYQSTSMVVVRQPDETAAATVPGLSMLLGGINPTSREETLYLSEYITSMDMLNVLREKLDWEKHYASQWRDPLYWISAKAPSEDLLKYYQRMVSVNYDELTGLLSVQVQSFDPAFAQQVLQIIMAQSERFVNEITHRIAREQVEFAEQELAKNRRAYEESRDVLIKFQNEHELIDANEVATSRSALVANLEASIAQERAALTGLLSNLASNTPQVRQQRSRVAALEVQLEAEKKRMVSQSSEGDRLNVVIARYHDLMINSGIAEETYKLSVAALENARIEATKKIRSVVVVISPNLPETSLFPERLYNLATLLVVLLLLYGVARFLIATIEDHRD